MNYYLINLTDNVSNDVIEKSEDNMVIDIDYINTKYPIYESKNG